MTLVGPSISTFAHGVASDETSINIQQYSEEFAPEFIDPIMNKSGEVRGKAIGVTKRTLTFSGQVSGTTGVMAFSTVTACTVANKLTGNLFGSTTTTGIALLNQATVSQSFDGWKTVSMTLEIYEGITAAS